MAKSSILEKNPKAEKYVLDLRKSGESYRTIAEKLNSEYDIDLSHQGVKNHIEARGGLWNEEDIELARRGIIDASSQMIELNNKLREILYSPTLGKVKCDNCGGTVVYEKVSPGVMVQIAQEIRKQLETSSALFSPMVKDKKDPMSQAQDINKMLEKLRKDGWLILHPSEAMYWKKINEPPKE